MPFIRGLFLCCTIWVVAALLGAGVQAQIPIPALGFYSFDGGVGIFRLTQASGTNRWMVNSVYNGSGGNPAVPDQTVAAGGAIGNPNTNYLHIGNTAFASQNAAYNTSVASSAEAEINKDFCTLNLVNVRLSFFWLADGGGNANNYGEVLYSTDGGNNWLVATSEEGRTKYFGQTGWKFETIKLPAFENVAELRFAFRWQNNGAGGAANLGFALDDVAVTAMYDPSNINLDPSNLTITFTPKDICNTANALLESVVVTSKVPLCQGSLILEMSEDEVNGYIFNDPPQNIQLGIGIGDYSSTGTGNYSIGDVPVPTASAATFPTKRKLRAIYENGFRLEGEASVDILTISNCPRTIITLLPAVATEDTVCITSVIDVPFLSTGFYNSSNQYVIQLSDVNGSFATPIVLGRTTDNNAYTGPPGEVSGLIMADANNPALDTLQPGCGYRVRIVSTAPVVPASGLTPSAPFCLKICPLESNNLEDFTACVDVNNPSTHTITYADTTMDPFPAGSKISFKLYKKADQNMDHNLDPVLPVIAPGFTASATTVNPDGTITFSLPRGQDLWRFFGFQPNETVYSYYGRFEVTHPSYPGGVYEGTLVRFTIFTINYTPLDVEYLDENFGVIQNPVLNDSILCIVSAGGSTTPVNIAIDYDVPGVDYESGRMFEWSIGGTVLRDWHEDYISFTDGAGLQPGSYPVSVRQITDEPGCAGPLQQVTTLYVQASNTLINGLRGPDKVCYESVQTISLDGPNLGPGTVVIWEVTNATILQQTSNSVRLRFGNVGSATVQATISGKCSASEKPVSKTIQVVDGPTPLDNPGNLSLCTGQSRTLSATSNGNIVWKRGTQVMGTGPSYTFESATPGQAQWTVESSLPGLPDCVRQERFNVLFNLAPTASFVADVDMGGTLQAFTGPTAIHLTNTSQDFVSFEWVVNGKKMGSSQTLTVDIPTEGTYAISLEAIGFSGCRDVFSRSVKFSSEIRVRFPSAFSPNNDNLNEYFGPIADNLKDGQLYIWNRWGELIFSISGPPEVLKWNGTKDGTPVQEGVYVYKFIMTDIRGQQQEYNGTVTLLH